MSPQSTGAAAVGLSGLLVVGETRIDIDAIDLLCAFFEMSVGELFNFVPETGRHEKT